MIFGSAKTYECENKKKIVLDCADNDIEKIKACKVLRKNQMNSDNWKLSDIELEHTCIEKGKLKKQLNNSLGDLKNAFNFVDINGDILGKDSLELPGIINEAFPNITKLKLDHIEKFNITSKSWPQSLIEIEIYNIEHEFAIPDLSQSNIQYLTIIDIYNLDITSVSTLRSLKNLTLQKLNVNSSSLQADIVKNLQNFTWIDSTVDKEYKFPAKLFSHENNQLEFIKIGSKDQNHGKKDCVKMEKEDFEVLVNLKKKNLKQLELYHIDVQCNYNNDSNLDFYLGLNSTLFSNIFSNESEDTESKCSSMKFCLNKLKKLQDQKQEEALNSQITITSIIISLLLVMVIVLASLYKFLFRHNVPKFPPDEKYHKHDIFFLPNNAKLDSFTSLIKELKTERSYNLVHQYDYQVGVTKLENEKNFMKSAKRIVFLVSKDEFCDSDKISILKRAYYHSPYRNR